MAYTDYPYENGKMKAMESYDQFKNLKSSMKKILNFDYFEAEPSAFQKSLILKKTQVIPKK